MDSKYSKNSQDFQFQFHPWIKYLPTLMISLNLLITTWTDGALAYI